MLCAGIIHGDLSEYNVLVDRDGPVIIDLPQAVDAAGNNNAAAMLKRDVANITTYFSRFAPALATTQYGNEIWSLYETATLHPETALTGRFEASTKPPTSPRSCARSATFAPSTRRGSGTRRCSKGDRGLSSRVSFATMTAAGACRFPVGLPPRRCPVQICRSFAWSGWTMDTALLPQSPVTRDPDRPRPARVRRRLREPAAAAVPAGARASARCRSASSPPPRCSAPACSRSRSACAPTATTTGRCCSPPPR